MSAGSQTVSEEKPTESKNQPIELQKSSPSKSKEQPMDLPPLKRQRKRSPLVDAAKSPPRKSTEEPLEEDDQADEEVDLVDVPNVLDPEPTAEEELLRAVGLDPQ